MSFLRYPHYKESGAKWLEQVPSHWELARIGHHFKERREKVSDKEFAALSVTKNGIVPRLETAAKTDDGDNRKKVCRGDFVINSRSDRKGSAGLSALDGSVSLINTVLTPSDNLCRSFLAKLLTAQPFQEEYYRYGKGIVADLWSTNYSEMRNILLALPSFSEQAEIASFLDHETSKIDVLIAEQERLIELLNEKRQAFISHAVTKGLNPDAPMKDSGIEWLGKVPEHWEIRHLGRLASYRKGVAFQVQDFCEDGIRVIRASDIKEGTIVESDVYLPKTHVSRYPKAVLTEGEILLSTVGSVPDVRRSAVGQIAIIPREAAGTLLNQNTVVFSPQKDRLDNLFLFFALQSRRYRDHLDLHAHGTANQASLNVADMLDFKFGLPPLEEQKRIAQFLVISLASIKELCTAVTAAMSLLRERRSALISAAVTGKIDVRGLASSESAKEAA